MKKLFFSLFFTQFSLFLYFTSCSRCGGSLNENTCLPEEVDKETATESKGQDENIDDESIAEPIIEESEKKEFVVNREVGEDVILKAERVIDLNEEKKVIPYTVEAIEYIAPSTPENIDDKIIYSEELTGTEEFTLNIKGEFRDDYGEIKSNLLSNCEKNQREQCFQFTKEGHYIDVCLRGVVREMCFSGTLPNHSILPNERCHLEWSPCHEGSLFAPKEIREKDEKILYSEKLDFWDWFRLRIYSATFSFYDTSTSLLMDTCQGKKQECFQYSLGPYYIKICIKGLLLEVCGEPGKLTETILHKLPGCALTINPCQ